MVVRRTKTEIVDMIRAWAALESMAAAEGFDIVQYELAVTNDAAGVPLYDQLLRFKPGITAQDISNNTVTSFTGTTDVTSNRSGSAGLGTTSAFTAGVLATIAGTSVISRFAFSVLSEKLGGRTVLTISLIGQSVPVRWSLVHMT